MTSIPAREKTAGLPSRSETTKSGTPYAHYSIALSFENVGETPKTVDQALAQWTAEQDAQEVATQLQACGVPAHPVLDTQDLYECPQLQGRDHFLEVEHDIYPTTTVEGSRLKYSRSQTRRPNRALNFGRDNREVLESILGYSPEEIAGLAERKVLR